MIKSKYRLKYSKKTRLGKVLSQYELRSHVFFILSTLLAFDICPVAGVLDEPFSQLTPLSGGAVPACQSTFAGTVSNLCSLEVRQGYSAERA
jgi:hypothetical protein